MTSMIVVVGVFVRVRRFLSVSGLVSCFARVVCLYFLLDVHDEFVDSFTPENVRRGWWSVFPSNANIYDNLMAGEKTKWTSQNNTEVFSSLLIKFRRISSFFPFSVQSKNRKQRLQPPWSSSAVHHHSAPPGLISHTSWIGNREELWRVRTPLICLRKTLCSSMTDSCCGMNLFLTPALKACCNGKLSSGDSRCLKMVANDISRQTFRALLKTLRRRRGALVMLCPWWVRSVLSKAFQSQPTPPEVQRMLDRGRLLTGFSRVP